MVLFFIPNNLIGTTYCPGGIVVLSVEDFLPVFGRVSDVVVRPEPIMLFFTDYSILHFSKFYPIILC